MKWLNAEQQVTVSIYDDEHEEYLDKIMTVEEMLDTYTNEGCPTIYSNPEQKMWIPCSEGLPEKCGCYLITAKIKIHDLKPYYEVRTAKFDGKYFDIGYIGDGFRVIAWMPLIQPYKED